MVSRTFRSPVKRWSVTRGPPAARRARSGLLEHCRAEDIVLSGESVPSVMNAVRAGIGVSALPCFAVHGNAALVRLTPTVVAQTEAFLVIPPDHRNTVRVRLVMDAVTALFERERALLSGCAAS